MDTNDFQSRYAQMFKDREAKTTATRNSLIKELGVAGITAVSAQYSGYGDSGNVDDVTLTPPVKLLAAVDIRLQDFIWDVAYNANPGFENNDGGEGTFEWDLSKDVISIEHGTHYTQTDWSTLENL